MNLLLKEIRHNPLLWLLLFVPIVFVAEHFMPEAQTLLFVMSVLAIVPLAALLSHATESVAAKTGDAVGGLLNATLGNLTELVIALTALKAGEYMLVKASIAGAIVTNTLFMLGASFLLGGLKYHVQEFNRAGARLQAGLLFLATIALLLPSAIGAVDSAQNTVFIQTLSLYLAFLLMAIYCLGLLFSLKTHRELFESAEHHDEADEAIWPLGLALGTLGGVTVLVALVSEVFVESVQGAALTFGMSEAFVGFIVVALVGGSGGNGRGVFGSPQGQDGPERRHRAGERDADRVVRGTGAGTGQLFYRADANEPAILARRRAHDDVRRAHGIVHFQQRPLGMVRGRVCPGGLYDLRHHALPDAAPRPVS